MTTTEKLRISAFEQWTALSGRSIAGGIRGGDIIFGAVTPGVFFVCFYVPLRHMMARSGIDYAQYLLPVIVIQSMLFTAMSATDRSASDSLGGMGTRLRALPVAPLAPVAARMTANLTRGFTSIMGGLVIGFALGFRFHGGIGDTVAFLGLALLFGLALAFGADALGAVSKTRETAAQVLLVPQLIFTMISSGIVPAQAFPGWVQPFVRNQPVSRLADALRGLADGSVDAATLGTALMWSIGILAVFAFLALRLERRER